MCRILIRVVTCRIKAQNIQNSSRYYRQNIEKYTASVYQEICAGHLF